MFKAPRHAPAAFTSPAPRAPVAYSKKPASSPNQDTAGVRQVMDEHRSITTLAGVILLAIGGTMIASEQYDEYKHKAWVCSAREAELSCASHADALAACEAVEASPEQCDATPTADACEAGDVATLDSGSDDAEPDVKPVFLSVETSALRDADEGLID